MNFKMYFDHERAIDWCEQAREIVLASPAVQQERAQLVVFPSFPSIPAIVEIFAGTGVAVGAQNMSNFASGAYTGEVSAAALAQVGCEFIEIGHAERRNLFGETLPQIRQKLTLAAEHGLTPLLCVGEAHPTDPAVAAQECLEFISDAISEVDSVTKFPAVIAYEPQWAIGAEQAADLEYIQSVTTRITDWLQSHEQLADSAVIYGGSAGPGLLTDLNGAVNGVFLGRRAHDPQVLNSVLAETIN